MAISAFRLPSSSQLHGRTCQRSSSATFVSNLQTSSRIFNLFLDIMAPKTKKKFFLVDASGYLYSVPRKDLKVCDPELVELESDVPFTYGSLCLQGKVLLVSEKESTIHERIRELKKEKKAKKSDSFDAKNPRKSAVKSGLLSVSKLPPNAASEQSQLPTASVKVNSKTKHLKDLRANAINKAEDELSDSDSSSDSESSLESNSSKCQLAAIFKAKAKAKDMAKLKAEGEKSSSESDSTVDLADEDASPLTSGASSKPLPNAPEDLSHVVKEEPKDVDDFSTVVKKEVVEEIPVPQIGNEENNCDNVESAKEKKKSKKAKKAKKSKKSKKSKKRKVVTVASSSEESQDDNASVKSEKTEPVVDPPNSKSSSSSSSSESESETQPMKRKSPKSQFVRNKTIYEGQNYLWKEGDSGVVKVHDNFDVWVQRAELDALYRSAKSASQFIRGMVEKVYTKEALQNSTAQGFPPRSKGVEQLKNTAIKCGLHPDGRLAILAKAELLENERKNWRPRVGMTKMSQAFAGKVTEFHH